MTEHARRRAQPERSVAEESEHRGAGEPAPAPDVAMVQQLQRTAGNQAVAALVGQDSGLSLARKPVNVSSGYLGGSIEVGGAQERPFEMEVAAGSLDIGDEGAEGDVPGGLTVEGDSNVAGAVSVEGKSVGMIEGIQVPPL